MGAPYIYIYIYIYIYDISSLRVNSPIRVSSNQYLFLNMLAEEHEYRLQIHHKYTIRNTKQNKKDVYHDDDDDDDDDDDGVIDVMLKNRLLEIQDEHKVFPCLQTFITRKLRGIQTFFFLNVTQEVFFTTH